jgi:hypothetical protein
MSRQRYYTNGAPYGPGEMKSARETLGAERYRQYGNFGPCLEDGHSKSYPCLESYQIGDWLYEVYEYECMSLSLGGHVSGPHMERAVRFLPANPNCEYSGLPSPAAYTEK